jgi:hypothetical protein
MLPLLPNWVSKEVVRICDNPETQRYLGFELKRVSMKVSPEVGRHWGDLHDYDKGENYDLWLRTEEEKTQLKQLAAAELVIF